MGVKMGFHVLFHLLLQESRIGHELAVTGKFDGKTTTTRLQQQQHLGSAERKDDNIERRDWMCSVWLSGL